jgi:hypothetical protein
MSATSDPIGLWRGRQISELTREELLVLIQEMMAAHAKALQRQTSVMKLFGVREER